MELSLGLLLSKSQKPAWPWNDASDLRYRRTVLFFVKGPTRYEQWYSRQTLLELQWVKAGRYERTYDDDGRWSITATGSRL